MLRLNVHFHTGEGLRTIQAIFRQASDVRPVLRRWGAWLRQDAKEHFDQKPGWAPLAESTRERLEQTRTSAVTVQGKLRTSFVKNSAAQFKRQMKAGIINSDTKLAELRRLARGGSTSYSLQEGTRRYSKALERARMLLDKAHGPAPQKHGDKRAEFLRNLGGKTANRRAIENHQLLGKLRTAIRAKVEQTRVVVENAISWSGVHNLGGTAGHGAKIPARTFLEVTERAAAMLAEIALEHLMGKDQRR